jgi:ribosomal protein L7/L12
MRGLGTPDPDIGFLRSCSSRGKPVTQPDDRERLELTRRDLFRLGGFTAAVLPWALQPRSLPDFEVQGDERRLAFLIDGTERWVIDPAQFGGDARLRIGKRTERDIRFSMRGARFAGTGLPADLRCSIRRRLNGWRAVMRFALAKERADCAFIEWLLGGATLAGTVFPRSVASFGANPFLAISQPSAFEFRPSWRFDFLTPGSLTLTNRWRTIGAHQASLAVAGDEAGPGSIVTMARADRSWKFGIEDLGTGHAWRLASLGEAFDQIRIDLDERGGAPRASAVALPSDDRASFRFLPGGELYDARAEPFGMNLAAPSLGISVDEDGTKEAFVARFADEPSSLRSASLALDLAGDGESAFELHSRNGALCGITCQPSIAGMAVPLPGAVVSTTTVDDPRARIDLCWESLECSIKQMWQGLFICRDRKTVKCSIPITTSILRPHDFVNLKFTFRNVRLKVEHGKATLCPEKPKYGETDCYVPLMIVEFPPQNIAERAYFKENDAKTDEKDPDYGRPETPGTLPIDSRIAEPSYLVFELVKDLPYTVDSLLSWDSLPEHLAPNAAPVPGMAFDDADTAPGVKKPGLVTSIEAPYRMMLSPHAGESWDSRATPRKKSDPYELWHVRLRNRDDNTPPAVRAIWSPDADSCFEHYSPKCEGQPSSAPFRTTLDRQDRHEIVHLSSDFKLCSLRTRKGWPAGAIPARHIILTSLGAWLDLEGHWDPFVVATRAQCANPIDENICKKRPYVPPTCDELKECPEFTVETWKHIATMGRDQFVRVIYAGFLMPFGHFAVLVKETYRDIEPVEDKKGEPPAAYLRQRMYIIVREPDKTYQPEDMCDDGRAFPYSRVKIDTLVTPDLDDPTKADVAPWMPGDQDRFWPRVGRQDFLFDITAFDHANPPKKIPFNAPLIFVSLKYAYAPEDTIDAYQDPTNDARVTRSMNGKKIAIAKPAKEGDTAVDTQSIKFGAQVSRDSCLTLRLAHRPRFEPLMREAAVRLPAVERMGGPAATPPIIKWDPTYIISGFSADANRVNANHGDVFARLANASPMTFPGDKSGGLATPDLSIQALSRLAGPIAGSLQSVDNFVQGAFEPLQFFENALDTKLLGVIKLGDVIAPVRDLRNQLAKIPRLLMEEVHAFDQAVEDKVNAFLAIIAAAVQKIEDDGFVLLRAGMFRVCQETLETLDPFLNDLQGMLVDTFSGYFSDQIEQQPLRYALPTLCTGDDDGTPGMRTASLRSPLRSMSSAAGDDAPRIVQYGAGFVTYRVFQEQLAKIEEILRSRTDVTATDIQKIQKTLDLGAVLQSTIRRFSKVVETAGSQIASIASLPIIEAFDKLTAAVGSFASGNIADKIIKFGDLLAALQRFVDEAVLLARNLLNPVQFLKPLVDQLADAVARLTTETLNIATDLQKAIDDAHTDFDQTADALPAAARAAIATVRAQLDTDLTNTAQQVINELTAPVAEALDPVTGVVGATLEEAKEAFDAYKAAIEGARDALVSLVKQEIEEIVKPREIRVNFDLHPALRSVPEGAPVFEATDKTDFTVNAQIVASLSIVEPGKPGVTFTVGAAIREFKIHLFPFAEFLTLDFDHVTINSSTGTGTNVDVVIRKIIFGEALKFVQTLQDYLPFDKGGNGFYIDIDTEGILVGYRFGIPTIAMGAMTLRGISISAALQLPFRNGPARVRFAFADRDRPFILSVGIFGGGGFFAVTLGADKVERLEGSFEFGVTAALTVGPANGEAHIFVGIYFNVDQRGARLSGFLDAGGNLDILGLITMSLLFHLAFVHDEATNTAYGEATLHVSFKIGPFYEVSLDLRCRREFSGGGSSQQAHLPRRADALVAGPPQLGAPPPLNVLVVDCDEHCGGTMPKAEDLHEYFSPDRGWDTYHQAYAAVGPKASGKEQSHAS